MRIIYQLIEFIIFKFLISLSIANAKAPSRNTEVGSVAVSSSELARNFCILQSFRRSI